MKTGNIIEGIYSDMNKQSVKSDYDTYMEWHDNIEYYLKKGYLPFYTKGGVCKLVFGSQNEAFTLPFEDLICVYDFMYMLMEHDERVGSNWCKEYLENI